MKGFVLLTTKEWLESIQKSDEARAVFWRKRKTFKAINIGEPIYFLQRGSLKLNKSRYVIGKGNFAGHEIMTANDVWQKYGALVGADTEEIFYENVNKMYGEHNPQLGCLIIEDLRFFDNPVSINNTKIDFSPCTVSGKIITDAECIEIDILSEE